MRDLFKRFYGQNKIFTMFAVAYMSYYIVDVLFISNYTVQDLLIVPSTMMAVIGLGIVNNFFKGVK